MIWRFLLFIFTVTPFFLLSKEYKFDVGEVYSVNLSEEWVEDGRSSNKLTTGAIEQTIALKNTKNDRLLLTLTYTNHPQTIPFSTEAYANKFLRVNLEPMLKEFGKDIHKENKFLKKNGIDLLQCIWSIGKMKAISEITTSDNVSLVITCHTCDVKEYLSILDSIQILKNEKQFIEIDVTQDLKILELMPPSKYTYIPAVEFAIPDDFIALEPDNFLYGGWTYWGPEEVLKAYFKDTKSLSTPILRARISTNVIQKTLEGPNREASENELRELCPNADVKSGYWGVYPYQAVEGTSNGEKACVTWIGLDSPQGYVLQIQMVFSHDNKKPGKEANAFWKKLISDTKALPEPLYFKVKGQEMHPGYTILNVGGQKAKVIAEKRKSDKKTQFAFIPLDKGITFNCEEATEVIMGAKWHKGEPMLKLYGVVKVRGGVNVNQDTGIAVLIKETDEFTKIPVLNKNVYFGEFHPSFMR